MRSYAVIPPLMLDTRQRRIYFENENGALTDMELEFKVCLYEFIFTIKYTQLMYFILFKGKTKLECLDIG